MSDDLESEIVHRELETAGENPAVQVSEIVADLEGKDMHEMRNTYDCLDHVVDHIFSNPPAPDAQVQITFSYEGYRVTVEQNGNAKFVKNA